MHEEIRNRELDDRLAELDARERTVELEPGARPLTPEEQEISQSLSRLSRLQAVVLALIIALACLLTVMIALGQVKLPAWARPEPVIVPEYPGHPTEIPSPAANPHIPLAEVFEMLQATDPFARTTALLCQHAPAGFERMVQWRYSVGGDRLSAPVRAPDGSVYLSSNGMLYALTNAGKLKWSWRPDADGVGAPAIGSDGQLYVNGAHGNVHALNQSGKLKWTASVTGRQCGSPLPAANGLVYVKTYMPNHTGNGYIYALSSRGSQRWCFEPPYEFDQRLLVPGPDNAVYDLHHDGMLLRVNADGQADWQLDVGASAKGPVPISGAVVVSRRASEGSEHFWQLSALNAASGHELWVYPMPTQPSNAPLAGEDGTVYIECYYGPAHNRNLPYRSGIWAIDKHGELLWQRDYPELDRLALLGVRDGEVYGSVSEGGFKLDATGEITLGLPRSEDYPELIGLGPDGLVFTQREGELIVLREP